LIQADACSMTRRLPAGTVTSSVLPEEPLNELGMLLTWNGSRRMRSMCRTGTGSSARLVTFTASSPSRVTLPVTGTGTGATIVTGVGGRPWASARPANSGVEATTAAAITKNRECRVLVVQAPPATCPGAGGPTAGDRATREVSRRGLGDARELIT
jgi:hypothetical protein